MNTSVLLGSLQRLGSRTSMGNLGLTHEVICVSGLQRFVSRAELAVPSSPLRDLVLAKPI